MPLGIFGCSLPTRNTPPALQATRTPFVPTRVPPTPTPLPTGTPTPEPESYQDLGKRSLLEGDWEASRAEFQNALGADGLPDLQAESLLGIAQTYALQGDRPEALQRLRTITTEYQDTPAEAEAYFATGQVMDSLQRYAEAAQAYQKYLELKPGVIDSYVLEKIGDSLQNTGDLENARLAYTDSVAAGPTGGSEALEIKIAQIYSAQGDYQTAIDLYQKIALQSGSDNTKAQMDYLSGIAYRFLGQPEDSLASFFHAVENYPRAYSSYLSLVELVDNGTPVNELQRGIVDYFAGQSGVAISALDRYLASEDEQGKGTALYYKGLALRELQNYSDAISAWDSAIENYPTDGEWAASWEEKAFTLWAYLDEYAEASQMLADFATQNPGHPRAAEFLFDAARISERNYDLEQASNLWEDVAGRFPESDYAFRSLFLVGITQYRIGDFARARQTFERAQGLASSASDLASVNLWIGKSEEILGEPVAARANWERASVSDPTGYYSERARDLLLEREPFTPPSGYDTGIDWDAERAGAEKWLQSTFNIPDTLDLTGPGALAGDARFIRGTEFWNLGLYEEASLEFEDLRKSVASSAEASYRLTNYLVDLGLYRSAIFAARQVLDLAGLDDAGTLGAPRYFNYLRFGTYYNDLVTSASQAYGFHPLFIYSVIRQESLFEGFIRSSAGARGLMQIIPSTGQYIYELNGWPPDYTADDLYRPNVSITFGTDHLNDLRDQFDGDLYAALAGYNAGQGNASIWKDLALGDPDLFLEIVRFSETQNYIRGIYEIFNIYRWLYDRSP
jgi:peptidoglycan lytic transglycosylase